MLSLGFHRLFILCVTKKMDSFHLFCQYFDLFLVFPSCIIDWSLGISNLIFFWRCSQFGASYFARVKRPNIVPFALFFLFSPLIFWLHLHKLLLRVVFFAKKILKGEGHIFEDDLPVLSPPEVVPHACFFVEFSIGDKGDIWFDHYVLEAFQKGL